MNYELANARIAERQRHYMAQGKDAATALRLAGADLPAEYEAYALRARDPAVGKAEEARREAQAAAGKLVAARARVHMATTGEKDIGRAQSAVLEADPELKRLYVLGEVSR